MRKSLYILGGLFPVALLGSLLLACPGTESDPDTPLSQSEAPPVASADFELDPAKQREIWEMEHYTFQLETYFGKPFCEALKSRDRQRMLGWFTGEFRGQLPLRDTSEALAAAEVRETVVRATEGGAEEVDAERFVDDLLRRTAVIDPMERARLRVLEIDRVGEDAAIYRARFLLTASGAARGETLAAFEATYTAQLFIPDEEQIKNGSILRRLDAEQEVERSSPRALFEEVTAPVGLADLGLPDNWLLPSKKAKNHRYQIAVRDFDRDGYPDIAVASIEGKPLLLRSIKGRRFEDVAQSVGLQPAPGKKRLARNALAGWIDLDGDGYPDLIMGQRVYRNLDGKKFSDVTAHSRLRFDRVPMGIVVADYDGDGDLDLYVVYQKKSGVPPPPGKRPWVGDSRSGGENELWINEAGGRFRNVIGQSGATGGRRQTFAASVFYYDEDHFPDLYLANDLGINVLLRNRGDGTFEDLSEQTRSGDFATSMGVATGDVDNDGLPEIYVGNMYSKMGRRIIAQVDATDYPPGIFEQIQGSCAGNRLYRRGRDDNRYRETSVTAGVNEVGWAYGPTMLDVDADGLLDLYATTGFMSFDRHEPDG